MGWVDVKRIKGTFQSQVFNLLSNLNAPNAHERIRHKLGRWRGVPFGLSGLPGHYTQQVHNVLLHISKETPPRVHAAVFRTLFNGWCTSRRFQKRHSSANHCVFRCSATAEDSLEHYCRCPIVRRVARQYLHLEYPCDSYVDVWMLNTGWFCSAEVRIGIAILIYGAYNAHNTARQGPIKDQQQAYHLIIQHCKQGTFGHKKASDFVDSAWRRPLKCLC